MKGTVCFARSLITTQGNYSFIRRHVYELVYSCDSGLLLVLVKL